ncbi:MoaD/ThiS family protein [Acetobacterium malicum]|uniref:MoaD/ThiS family protein n=1 Tax=Acetobacterium malicum TaxID=52692 RepID=UPI0003FAF11F|nr:MoaD/ThiS family protein [Acetobacterium dehalogenans]
MIYVKYKGELRRYTNTSAETLDCTSLRGLLRLFKKNYGRDAQKAMRQCHIVVNGKRANLELTLQENDEVVFIPVCCGG